MIRYLLICCCLIIGTTAFSQTSLSGKVIDDTGEPVLFGNIALYKNGVLLSGGTTDIDGNYSLVIQVYSPKKFKGLLSMQVKPIN